MTFTDEQKQALAAKLDAKHVLQRTQAGRSLSYIEGWHAIAEANRIFGFDGWSRETIDLRCTWEGERETRNGPKPAASYIAKVRVTVGDIVREGTGSGSGFGSDVGEAHESAVKEAETDAMKRALMTFGNPFGLALYDKEQKDVERVNPLDKSLRPDGAMNQPPIKSLGEEGQRELGGNPPFQPKKRTAQEFVDDALAFIKRADHAEMLSEWWRENSDKLERLSDKEPKLYTRFLTAYDDKMESFRPPKVA